MSDGFLSRWARRKEAVRVAEQSATREASLTPTAPSVGDLDGATELQAISPLPSSPHGASRAPDDRQTIPELGADAEPDLLADLPSLDALTPETDLTPFLRSGVPTALRNAALRRMWSLDPGIRDFVSEAREYAYDWNTPGGVPGLGPLLPSDDVKAMLGRLFRDPAEAKALPVEHPQESIDESNPAPADATPPVEAALEGEPVPDEAMRPATAAIPSAPQSEVAQVPSMEPRMRRHGGAIPV
ncbi:DUF3306 domain-containing protein [Methylorubrum sp. POS3]|uniref:DUF3306 domain-containing protein n=1 Tax=Methylorubrum sp. POS3 TaxID=2998492 RepID=UPI003727AC4B